MKYPKLLAYAQLLRLPNVFTAFADICMAGAVSGAVISHPISFACVLLASGLLYLSGMVWNDFYDREEDAKARPFRPIPSGRVTAEKAASLGAVLMAVGLAFAMLARELNPESRWYEKPLFICFALCVTIHQYDGWLKRTPYGPLGMGLCRFLNVWLGFSAAPGAVPVEVASHLAAAVGVYIVGVTWFARTEEGESHRFQLRLASLVMLAGVLLGLTVPVHFEGRGAPVYFPYMVAGFLFLVGLPVVRAIQRPDPKHVQTAVKRAILGLVVLDAVLATAFVGLPGLLILLLLPPALWLGKWVYST